MGLKPVTVLLAVVAGLVAFVVQPPFIATTDLPARYSSPEFWALSSRLSEPGGYFRSDNFVSNEVTFQHVIPALRRTVPEGNVYVGVGPDQNFTYIAALKPRVAFIVDIRRQNLLLHLIYKSAFELAADRRAFMTLLFSRPMDGVASDASIEDLVRNAGSVAGDRRLFDANLARIRQHLRDTHGFPLSEEDWNGVEYVYGAFFQEGPDIRYSPSGWGGRRFPNWGDLVIQADAEGIQHGYLATEENFRILKSMHGENRIIPLVGDFAGETALRALAAYLNEHGAVVGAFYTSNVEFYLFQGDGWRAFYDSVREFPRGGSSVFVRSYFNNFNRVFRPQMSGVRSVSVVDPVNAVLDDVQNGTIRSYYQLMDRSAGRN